MVSTNRDPRFTVAVVKATGYGKKNKWKKYTVNKWNKALQPQSMYMFFWVYWIRFASGSQIEVAGVVIRTIPDCGHTQPNIWGVSGARFLHMCVYVFFLGLVTYFFRGLRNRPLYDPTPYMYIYIYIYTYVLLLRTLLSLATDCVCSSSCTRKRSLCRTLYMMHAK